MISYLDRLATTDEEWKMRDEFQPRMLRASDLLRDRTVEIDPAVKSFFDAALRGDCGWPLVTDAEYIRRHPQKREVESCLHNLKKWDKKSTAIQPAACCSVC
ncbi:hypothetical protein OQA88_5832 [Cercophora sp. LCS_1]